MIWLMIIILFLQVVILCNIEPKNILTYDDRFNVLDSKFEHITKEMNAFHLSLNRKIENLTDYIERTNRNTHENSKTHNISQKIDEFSAINNTIRLEMHQLNGQIRTNQNKLQEVLNIWAEILKARKK